MTSRFNYGPRPGSKDQHCIVDIHLPLASVLLQISFRQKKLSLDLYISIKSNDKNAFSPTMPEQLKVKFQQFTQKQCHAHKGHSHAHNGHTHPNNADQAHNVQTGNLKQATPTQLKILKGSLDLIPSPSHSVKIQIMGRKVCLRCKGKTLLGVVNKLLKTKSLLTSPTNIFPYYFN